MVEGQCLVTPGDSSQSHSLRERMVVEHGRPLYVHPSDTSGCVPAPVKLTGSENYGVWSRAMRISLLAKKKLGFVTGKCTKDSFDESLHEQLKEMWNESDVIAPSPNCGCPKLKDYIEYLQQQRLMQFLSGLNESYDQAKRQILMKSTASTVNQAYALIVQDESQ
ncbi:uncharacterized protein LOC129890686 [Solanum dulcamara]|uniref:uncharacterized protein LOC129890686 n=1 Tax=Solanum dulcamara TaxID=45834 RepID=UPI0024868F50|nr:uncharacterized protein LOC129890686 [Solanum dulcamara]